MMKSRAVCLLPDLNDLNIILSTSRNIVNGYTYGYLFGKRPCCLAQVGLHSSHRTLKTEEQLLMIVELVVRSIAEMFLTAV